MGTMITELLNRHAVVRVFGPAVASLSRTRRDNPILSAPTHTSKSNPIFRHPSEKYVVYSTTCPHTSVSLLLETSKKTQANKKA